MPIEKDTTEIEVTKEKTTVRYICDADGCDEHTENWDPKGDEDIAFGHDVGHTLHYIALDPYIEHRTTLENGPSGLGDRDGIYLCEEHLDRAGEILSERIAEAPDS